MIKTNTFRPKKHLGQNFLVNPNTIDKIIRSCNLKSSDTVLEIGPGKGALTRPLSDHCKKVIAIEKDEVLAGQLKHRFIDSNVTVIHGDILKYPFSKFPRNIKVIGNLPYNIATPIIKKVIDHRRRCTSFYMTVQLEYGQRMAAKSSTSHYGSFSCFVQYYSDITMCFKIGRPAFQPAPKVQSCFLHMNFLKKPRNSVKNEEALFNIIRGSFGQRRKTIQNSLAGVVGKNHVSGLLEKLRIDPKLRAENLDLKDYVRIVNAVSK